MKTIAEYVDEAITYYDSHRWDQWDMEYSAKSVAVNAFKRGEISKENIGFLSKQIVSHYDKKCQTENEKRIKEIEEKYPIPAVMIPFIDEINKKKPELKGWGEHVHVISIWRVAVEKCEKAYIAGNIEEAKEFAKAGNSVVIPGNYTCPVPQFISNRIKSSIEDKFTGNKTVTKQGEWISHEDSFGGLSGGDYSEWSENTPDWDQVQKIAEKEAEKVKKILES